MSKKQKIRIRLRTYDHEVLDNLTKRIVEASKATGVQVSDPVPLPTDKGVITISRSVHKHKDSREQFEQRAHKRLIDITSPNQKMVDSLMKSDLPASVNIEIKL